jgi:hypothetical protein
MRSGRSSPLRLKVVCWNAARSSKEVWRLLQSIKLWRETVVVSMFLSVRWVPR